MARNNKKNTNTTEEVVNKVEEVKEETVAAKVITDEMEDVTIGENQAAELEEEALQLVGGDEIGAEISVEEIMTNDEIGCDTETSTEEKTETEEVKEEAPKEEKPKMKHKVRYYEEVYGCNWNGQCFDY